jgi:hypothetical protein
VSELPRWLTLKGQIRGRFEVPWGVGYKSGSHDFDYANRLRLDLGVNLGKYARAFAEMQDSRLFGYDQGAKPASSHNPVDLRQAWVELGKLEGGRVRLRVGRQEMRYADGWLVSAADWGNNARVFDGTVLSANVFGFTADGFAATVVQADGARVDRRKPAEHLYGTDWQHKKLIPGSTFEAFMMAKTNQFVTGELGVKGDAATYAGGGRTVGKLPYDMDYSAMLVREWGFYGTDTISAWGSSSMLGWTMSEKGWKPRLSAEAMFASGDGNAKDGSRGTFDQMYAGLHYFTGTADRIGWRNVRNLRAGVNFSPTKRLKVICNVHDYALMTVKDGLYNTSGGKDYSYPNAPSRHVGLETDAYFTYQVSAATLIGAGFGHMLPGGYLKYAGKTGAFTYPYVMLTRNF